MFRNMLVAVAGVLLLALRAPAAETMPAGVAVRADWRVELVSIVFRLAGNPEYTMANSKSVYAEAVEAHFGKFRGHAVVEMARELRRTRGVSYDAVMSLAVHLDREMPPKAGMRLEPRPALLDSRWRAGEAEKFIGLLGAFSKDADFAGFWGGQKEHLAACAERLGAVVNRQPIVPFFDGYFGKRPTAAYTVVVGMLCGGGNYGMSARFPDGREEITPVIGIYRWDARGLPAVGEEVRPTLIHEFCHSYTNALVNAHWGDLEQSAGRLFERNAAAMRRMAYGESRTLMYESMVRACVVRCVAGMRGEPAGREQATSEVMSGFVWTIELAGLLKEYERDRGRYATLDAFMPRVAEFFEKTAADYESLLAKFPQVKAVSPANGATEVDAGTEELVVTFDRPMKEGSWSIVTGGGSPVFGRPRYEEGRKVLRVPMTVEAGRKYGFSLNAGRFHSFVSEEGYPLLPVEVAFTTK